MSSKFVSLALLAMIVLGFTTMAFAEEAKSPAEPDGSVFFHNEGAGKFGGPIGAGLVLFGGAAGISRIGVAACESIARQPEAGGRIFTSMIITAAMIEGATFFAVLVCMMAL